MARAKGKVSAKSKAKAGYLTKKTRAMLRRGKRMEKAAKNIKKKESSSFIPEPKDLGAMMRNQQKYNAQMDMNKMGMEMNNMGNNSVGEKQFAKMMRNHQKRVTKKKIGIFRRQTPIRQTPTRAHGVKKGKKARGNKKSKKSSKNNNRK